MIQIEQWGKDHWSLLAYFETCAVDHKGVIDNRRMRTNARLHRHMVGINMGRTMDAQKYPTILRDGSKVDRHDDWSCAEDIKAQGLIELTFESGDEGVIFGSGRAWVTLTEQGFKVAAELRQWKAIGGQFRDFILPAELRRDIGDG